jgi:hypothetical protein
VDANAITKALKDAFIAKLFTYASGRSIDKIQVIRAGDAVQRVRSG